MKKIFYKLSVALVLCASVSSCKRDFLEKAPGVSLDEDDIFQTREKVESYLGTAYKLAIPAILPNRENAALYNRRPDGTTITPIYRPSSGATDESDEIATFVGWNAWNDGNITPDNILTAEDMHYFGRYQAIRICNIVLERADEIPSDANFKTQVKGEALFLRAMTNFETLKRYGGFPIIKTRLTPAESSLKRDKLEDCFNFILSDIEQSLAAIPAGFPAADQRGRASKSAVLALKSRVLLYAASPIFNTVTPYLPMNNPSDNLLIVFGNESAQRWKDAADAAVKALEMAYVENHRLLDAPAKRDPAPSSENVIAGNYREAWETLDNVEWILAYKGNNRSSYFGFPWQGMVHNLPNMTSFAFWSTTDVNHDFVKRYESKTTGERITWPTSGPNLYTFYNQLDTRFNQSVAFNGYRYLSNSSLREIELHTGGAHAGSRTGAILKKLTPDEVSDGNSAYPREPVFRYNELLLNYAEALNEFSGPPTSSGVTGNKAADYLALAPASDRPANDGVPTLTALDAVNLIRRRSGMPLISHVGLTKESFRQRIRNERAIELAFESHRFWDIRRWLIADNIENAMTRPLLGLTLVKTGTKVYSFQERVVENRTFRKKMYLHPFDRNELKRSPLFVQNPGY